RGSGGVPDGVSGGVSGRVSGGMGGMTPCQQSPGGKTIPPDRPPWRGIARRIARGIAKGRRDSAEHDNGIAAG
ncbi:hypothetical protein, partial [Nguyenibacter vanlangensis]|uniref:hypothetical protein n=1 Tax=Nguyenibacter vanlangensis TaxID=1216886 RepID=UPI001C4007B7